MAVVDVAAEEAPVIIPRDMTYCRFPLLDGEQDNKHVIRTAVNTTAAFIRSQLPTLVACGAGVSRSPAIVAGALAVAEGTTPDECLKRIAAGHPHDLSPQLWEDVKRVLGEIQ